MLFLRASQRDSAEIVLREARLWTLVCTSFISLEAKQPNNAERFRIGLGDQFVRSGARGRIRTADTAIFSRMLYQLSYPGLPSLRPF